MSDRFTTPIGRKPDLMSATIPRSKRGVVAGHVLTYVVATSLGIALMCYFCFFKLPIRLPDPIDPDVSYSIVSSDSLSTRWHKFWCVYDFPATNGAHEFWSSVHEIKKYWEYDPLVGIPLAKHAGFFLAFLLLALRWFRSAAVVSLLALAVTAADVLRNWSPLSGGYCLMAAIGVLFLGGVISRVIVRNGQGAGHGRPAPH